MYVTVKLDCEVGNEEELFKHQGALLAAFMVCNAYIASKEDLFGVGPELYAELWMRNYLRFPNEGFDDLIMIYFVKILQATQNVK